jgi:subtilisin family serine protease
MVRTRVTHALIVALVLSLLLAPGAQAEVRPVTDAGEPPGASLGAPPQSPRLIVELTSPPLAAVYQTDVAAAAVSGRLDTDAAAAQAYISQLQAEQSAFVSALQTVLPSATVSTYRNETGASVAATYQILFNGLSIEPGADLATARAQLARLPGVKAVYPDKPYVTHLYTSTALINAPVLWENAAVGGRESAGAGIKVASMDGGVHKDAPMMNGEGYTYPPGYGPNGLGLTANNNGKIIVSRVYFRDWDPPAPGDENPWPGANGTSHGTHTASTAAGEIVTATYSGFDVGVISGVAPKAYVMSYRVFYSSVNGNESFYTTEGLAALEDIVKDGADVVNNSWGEGPISEGGLFDPLDTALINATKAGIFVSMSTGNSGPGLGTSDHPSRDYINVAASTTSGTLASGRISVPGEPELEDVAFAAAAFGAPLPIATVVEYPFVPSVAVDPANVLGCDPWPAGAFEGKAALIERGVCEFGVKVLNAEQAGAEFVIVYNHAQGGDDLINMGPGAVGNQVTISSIFIGRTDGLAFVNFYNTNGPEASIVRINTIAFQLGNDPDRIISFSSRGPGVGHTLKPDIAAPGVNILAQGYTPGVSGEARHLGFGQVSGTSMAAPHVAGAAALLRQIHPDWSPAHIKSALMSTAKFMDIYLADGVTPAQPLDMGAGRLDLTRAADPGVILTPPSLSYGQVPTGTQKSLSVWVTSVAGAAETYNLSTLYTGDSFTQTTELPGFSVSPASITLEPGESQLITVTFESAASAGLGDNQGYIILDGETYDAHLPAWVRVMHATQLADVLIIDNDFSDLLQPYDYLWYYTNTLDQLGYSYDVWNTDDFVGNEVTFPDATTLAAYRAVLYFTGDHYQPDGTFSVPTPPTQLDQDRLVEYLNGGGALIAMGQDLSGALDADEFDAPVGSRNFLYVYRLGANWVQDSISNEATPNQYIVPTMAAPALFGDVVVDLTQPRKYEAAGQLLGANEVPPVTTDTTGSFSIRYDVDQNELDFTVTVQPTATTPITVIGAHIHVGAEGVNGPIVRDLAASAALTLPVFVSDSLTFSGVVTPSLSAAEVAQMLAGGLYINVHTTANPAGEIRGQIEPSPVPNQPYVDEIDNVFHDGSQDPRPDATTSESNLGSTLILRYAGPFNRFDGAVAVAHRDQPSLERPGTDYSGRSVYASFGLEGMNNNFNPTLGFTPTTRAELLGKMLDWAWSEPAGVVISDTTAPNASLLTTFSASLAPTEQPTGTIPATAVSYRWDFGDGSGIVGPFPAPEAGHQYHFCGEHSVRVEITDSYGNVSLGSQRVLITENCSEWGVHLPWIERRDEP